MKKPAEIRFLGMDPSPALEEAVRRKIGKLEQFCPTIIACSTSIELPHKHQLHGRPVAVRIDLTVPGHDLTVSRVSDEDAYVALRDAFDGMNRQLEDLMRRERSRRREPGDVAIDADQTGAAASG